MIPPGAARAAIVVQPDTDFPVDAGIEQRTFLLDEGEEAKCMESVEELCRASPGGASPGPTWWWPWAAGVVTDTAGFAAAVYHRGVAVVHVSTTLLGMVDAAIGGKTGVNLPEGKNLVGAFWQPSAVLCDTELLGSLPPREYRSGLGEMAKYAFLGVDDLPDLPLDEAVAACVRCKADHVGPDERDTTGRRALLNYGHTLAHALETTGHYDLRHGEAVAVGLVFAARLAHRLGRVDDERVEPSTWPSSAATTCRRPCPRGPTRPSWSRSWAGTRRSRPGVGRRPPHLRARRPPGARGGRRRRWPTWSSAVLDEEMR